MIEAGSLLSVVMGGFLKGVPPGDLEKCGLPSCHLFNVYF